MDKPTSDFSPIETMMMQRVAFFAIRRSIDMGVFDKLEAEGGLSAQALSQALGLDERKAEGLLKMLAVVDVVEERDGAFANTLMASEYLVTTSPFFQGKALALHVRFNDAIEERFDGLLQGDDDARKFSDDGWGADNIMDGTAQHARMGTLQDTVAFTAGLPGFNDMRAMCDIGGNHGAFTMALLDRNQDLHGEIVDLPHVVSAVRERIRQAGYNGRLNAVACDLRNDKLPQGAYDLVLASHVLYAFMESMAEQLKHIYASLRPGGWFVSQHLDPKGAAPCEYTSVVEFITRMAGYGTHHIEGGWLMEQLGKAGFADMVSDRAGQSGLLVAARKP